MADTSYFSFSRMRIPDSFAPRTQTSPIPVLAPNLKKVLHILLYRKDRKRSHDDNSTRPSNGGYADTPRPPRGSRYDAEGFPKRGRYDQGPRRGGPGMPNPGMFRPPMMGSRVGPSFMAGGPMPPFVRGPGMPQFTGATPPQRVIRKQLQYNIMGYDEWKSKEGKDTEENEAEAEYTKFKVRVTTAQMRDIFEANKDHIWFRELYHPDSYNIRQTRLSNTAKARLEIFKIVLAERRLDKITWKAEDRKALELLVKDINRLMDVMDEPADADDDAATNRSGRRLSLDIETLQEASNMRTFSVELLLTDIYGNPFFGKDAPETDIQSFVKDVTGFRRLSVAAPSDASPLKLAPGERKIWATFSGVGVKVVEKELSELQFNNTPMRFQLVGRNLDAIRTPETCVIVGSDKELAGKIISVLDARHGLEGPNPVTSDDEASLEKVIPQQNKRQRGFAFVGCTRLLASEFFPFSSYKDLPIIDFI